MPEDKDTGQVRVGQILKKRRQSLRLSLDDVALGTKIRLKYLVGIEAADYSDLPNDIYTKGFVANYADYLGLDIKAVTRQYLAERGGEVEAVSVASPRMESARQLILTPRLAAVFAVLLAVSGVVGYLAWQFTALGAPPKLELTSPAADQVIAGSLIDVTGRVSGGADVFINDSPVLTDAAGRFNDKLALQDGVNILKVTARNRLGKTTSISRNILAELPKVEDEQGAVPAEPFDGVALNVSIKNAATWLIIEVDGKEAFRGTMLAGTSQQFRGSRVKLTTGNAGNTHVLITNAIVANKTISPVGKDGEILRNLEFAKDTSFQ